MAKIDEIGKKTEEALTKNEPDYTDYQFSVRCFKSPDGLTKKACSIIDIRTIEPLKEDLTTKTAEVSTEIPQKDSTPVAVVPTHVDMAQSEIKPGEKDPDPECDLCIAIAAALKEQTTLTAAAEKTEPAPRQLRWRSPPEVRHRRMKA
jgi:hypothetical protein